MAFIPAIIVGGQLVIAVADRVPQFNFEPTCRAATSEALGMNDHFDECVKSEKGARAQLATQWSGYDASDRARCGRTAATGGSPSYVELLTCLEMGKQAKSLHARGDQTAIIGPEPSREFEPASPPPLVQPGPPVQPGPVAQPRERAVAAPTALAQPRDQAAAAPTPLTPPQQQQNELLASFCRSPWGMVLPACK